MRKYRRLLAALGATGITVGLLLVTATSGSATAKKPYVIGFLGNLTLPVNVDAENATIAEAKKLGVKLVTENVGDFTAPTSALKFGEILSQHPQIIIGNLGSVPGSSIQIANARHIPIVTYINDPLGGKVTTLLDADEAPDSKLLAIDVFKILGGHGQVAYIQGDKTISAGAQREQGFREALKLYPNIDLVDYGIGAWSTPTSDTVTLNFLTAHPQIGAVLTDYDEMALGAVDAAHQDGLHIVTSGTDGECPTLQSIWQGGVTVTLDENWAGIASQSVQVAVGILNGKTYPKVVYTPAYIVDKSVMQEVLAGTYKPQPPGDAAGLPALKKQIQEAVGGCK